jgi:hypothetical protein
MPAIIDSAPSCIVSNEAMEPADDSADFILQANYQDCAGFGTFMPGSTYGPEGEGATTAYMALTWLGIVVTVLVLIAWVAYENRRLIEYSIRGRHRGHDDHPPAQPGVSTD